MARCGSCGLTGLVPAIFVLLCSAILPPYLVMRNVLDEERASRIDIVTVQASVALQLLATAVLQQPVVVVTDLGTALVVHSLGNVTSSWEQDVPDVLDLLLSKMSTVEMVSITSAGTNTSISLIGSGSGSPGGTMRDQTTQGLLMKLYWNNTPTDYISGSQSSACLWSRFLNDTGTVVPDNSLGFYYGAVDAYPLPFWTTGASPMDSQTRVLVSSRALPLAHSSSACVSHGPDAWGVASAGLSFASLQEIVTHGVVGQTGFAVLISGSSAEDAASALVMASSFSSVAYGSNLLENPSLLALLLQGWNQLGEVFGSTLRCVVVFVRVPGLVWTLITCIPDTDYSGSTESSNRTSLVVLCVSSVVCFAIMLVLWRLLAVMSWLANNFDDDKMSTSQAQFMYSAIPLPCLGCAFKEINTVSHRYILMRERLDNVERTRETFLRVIFHELRGPMHNVTLGTELLLGSEELPQALKEVVQIMFQASTTCVSVINDWLVMKKIASNTFSLEPTTTDLTKLVKEVLASYQLVASQKQVALTSHGFDNLPLLHLDYNRWRTILSNLVSNALKFTHKGSVVVSAKAATRTDFDIVANQAVPDDVVELQVSVQDTGLGISDTFLPSLFLPFSQDQAGRNQGGGGTGLGLSICKSIVELHADGRLSCRSTVGVGSTFLVQVTCKVVPPLAYAVLPEEEDEKQFKEVGVNAPSEPVQLLPQSASQSPSEFAIMVVDDLATLRTVLRLILQNIARAQGWICSVVMCSDGDEVLEILRQNTSVALVFMDQRMARMTGSEATRQLRAAGFTLPVIGMTGDADEQSAALFLGAGANEVLFKPSTKANIEAVLSRYLHHQ